MPKYKEYLKILEHASNDSDKIIQARINELKIEIGKLNSAAKDLEKVNSTQKSDIKSLNKKISGKNDDITRQSKSIRTLEKSIKNHVSKIKEVKENSEKISTELKSEKNKNDGLNSKNAELHNQNEEIANKNKQLQLQSEKSEERYKSQKKRTEVLTKNLKETEKQKKENENQINKLQNHIDKQEKKIKNLDSTVLQEKYGRLSSRYDSLKKKHNNLVQKHEELISTNIKINKSRRRRIILFVLLSIVCIFALAVDNLNLKESINRLSLKVSEYQRDNKGLSNKINDLENLQEVFAGNDNDFIIKNITVRNNATGTIGLSLSTSEITYIRPLLDLYSLIEGVISIGYMEYNPNGTKITRARGVDFIKFETRVKIGKNEIYFPDAWGKDKKGWKSPGTYRYEFYINDEFITSQKYKVTK